MGHKRLLGHFKMLFVIFFLVLSFGSLRLNCFYLRLPHVEALSPFWDILVHWKSHLKYPNLFFNHFNNIFTDWQNLATGVCDKVVSWWFGIKLFFQFFFEANGFLMIISSIMKCFSNSVFLKQILRTFQYCHLIIANIIVFLMAIK